MSNDITPTPMTDTAARPYAVWAADNTRPDRELVDAYFARTLERELAAAKSENADLRKDRERLRQILALMQRLAERVDQSLAKELSEAINTAMEGGDR